MVKAEFTVPEYKKQQPYISGRINYNKKLSSNFLKTQHNPKISFMGLHGASWYGTQADKDALNYQIKLTPDKVEENASKFGRFHHTKGLMLSCNTLGEDAKNVYGALIGMQSVLQKVGKVINEQFKEMASYKPKHSSIPVVGTGFQAYDYLSGNFERKMNEYYSGLREDMDDVIKVYWNNGLLRIYKDYNQSSHILGNKIKKKILIRPKLKSNLSKNIGLLQNQITKNYTKLNTAINNQSSGLYPVFNKIFEKQDKKQFTRTLVKLGTLAVELIGGFGLADTLVNSGADFLTSGGDLLAGLGTNSFGQMIATNSSIDFLANVGLDSVGNTAKEVSHNKSSKIINLTEKSLVNVLRKIK